VTAHEGDGLAGSGAAAPLVNAGPRPYDETGIRTSWKSWCNAMSMPHVIVCERNGTWAAAVRRQLPSDIRMRQTRGLAECAAELRDAPMSLLVLELTAQNLAGVLDLLGRLPGRFPLARAIVVSEAGLKHCEWLVREAGAIYFAHASRDLAGLEETVRNHLQRMPAAKAGFAAQVWESLPWGDAATA
jgi:hypothetical protein